MTYNSSLLKIAFFSLLLVALSGCRNDAENTGTPNSDLELKNARIDSLSSELERQENRNDSLQDAFKSAVYANDYSIFFGKEWEEIENPEEHISNSLKQQTDLIPLDAVLGGNMEFRQVQVISEDWVLAIYDDGHVQGKSIFAYELQADGDVEFTEIASRLPQ